MTWYEKSRPTQFDRQPPLDGLFYLDGDIVAETSQRPWTRGQKLPLIAFPSGEYYEVWEATKRPERGGMVHFLCLS